MSGEFDAARRDLHRRRQEQVYRLREEYEEQTRQADRSLATMRITGRLSLLLILAALGIFVLSLFLDANEWRWLGHAAVLIAILAVTYTQYVQKGAFRALDESKRGQEVMTLLHAVGFDTTRPENEAAEPTNDT